MQQNIQNESFQLPDLAESRAIMVVAIAAQLMVVLVMLFRDGLAVNLSIFLALTVYVQTQAILSAVALSLVSKPCDKLPRNLAAATYFLVLMAVAFIMAVVADWYVHPLLVPRIDYSSVARALLISAIVIGVTLRYLYVQQDLIEQEKTALKANLAAMQARMRPHFLFNTMNAIASLISFAPEKAEQMIEDLCELLRVSLNDEVETTLEKEWRICQRYLAIEKIRIGDRLQWAYDFGPVDMQIKIPKLSLQPIIENAIYHGIQPCPDGGKITITASYIDEIIEIKVINTQSKKYMIGRTSKGNHIAVDNTRRRLKQLYGAKSELELIDHSDTFEVNIRYIPRLFEQGE